MDVYFELLPLQKITKMVKQPTRITERAKKSIAKPIQCWNMSTFLSTQLVILTFALKNLKSGQKVKRRDS